MTPRLIPLVAGLLLALAPIAVLADESVFATATLYEVREAINCNPGGSVNPLLDPLCAAEPSQGFGTRIASATLLGSSTGPATGEFTGVMTTEASSVLSQVDWTGPAHGKITVTGAAGTNLAVFSGQLDLSRIAAGTAPQAPIAGHWQGAKGTLRAGGRFDGTFLVPVGCTATSTGLTGCVYLVPGVGFVPLAENEFATVPGFGTIPLVKLLVTFFTR